MMVCGANGVGYYNVRDHVWTCGFDSAAHEAPGNVALISQSGSGMSGIIDCEERVRINLAVSTGIELSTTMDEYLDFVLFCRKTFPPKPGDYGQTPVPVRFVLREDDETVDSQTE